MESVWFWMLKIYLGHIILQESALFFGLLYRFLNSMDDSQI